MAEEVRVCGDSGVRTPRLAPSPWGSPEPGAADSGGRRAVRCARRSSVLGEVEDRFLLSPDQDKLSLKDELGFRKVNDEEDEEPHCCDELLQSCKTCDKNWDEYRASKGEKVLIRSKRLVDVVSANGVSKKDRAAVWYAWSGASRLQKNSKLSYQEILREASKRQDGALRGDFKQIELDLGRTFPSHPLFEGKSSRAIHALRRLLVAISYHTGFGYYQGMNFLAGFILLVVRKESVAFWIFRALLDSLDGYYRESLAAVRSDLDFLHKLTKKHLPKLAQHFVDMGLSDFSLCFPKWLMCLYVNQIPNPLLLKLWDCFWCQRGNRKLFLYRTAMHLLSVSEQELLDTDNLGDLYLRLQTCGDRVKNATEFLSGSIHQVISVTGDAGDSDHEKVETPKRGKRKLDPSLSNSCKHGEEIDENRIPLTPMSKVLHSWITNGTPMPKRNRKVATPLSSSKITPMKKILQFNSPIFKQRDSNWIEMRSISKKDDKVDTSKEGCRQLCEGYEFVERTKASPA
eukprot:CAMPEP_0198238680 /NCGR_PEP_ID=MMETSP1446-20131203/4290_1 /TAXON_ID=1461542 ORGANISM="Unidentified sp, Strain CCMP2111" /NCGR_SAMPLE_ID=MMETSP1446 /ASSEMBLY_ACC=CAM_ASM_001112 /LENGTH=514 /DNA_ID=CAMNT_0043921147 /DNA_START=46 /DNA_END=1590 /DNA_ORIENTATION=-